MTIFSNISQPFEGKVLGNWANFDGILGNVGGNSSTDIVVTSAHHKRKFKMFWSCQHIVHSCQHFQRQHQTRSVEHILCVPDVS